MVQLKRNMLSVALVTAIGMVATTAHAQSAAANDSTTKQDAKKKDDKKVLDAVVVTGIRGGMQRAIDAKQQSDNIVEAVSAEDIGKLPDVSIADSISRLPGLTAQRFGGRAQEINIRGFSGDFSTTTLNGREQVSLGNNRGVEFDQYPSELMSGVVVYKTQNANLVGQGLSGTVDLHSVRPLDYSKRTVALNLRGDMNKLGSQKQYGNRFSVAYIDQFLNHTVGLALGYAHLNNPYQTNEFGSWGYDGSGLPTGVEAFHYKGKNDRHGLMGTLQVRPNSTWTSTLDVFYSRFDKDESKTGLQAPTDTSWSGDTVSNVVNGGGRVQSATFNNLAYEVLRNDANFAHDKLFSIGWRNDIKLNDAWRLMFDVSRSSATRHERILESYAGYFNGVKDSVTVNFNPAGYYNLAFGRPYTGTGMQLGDPGGWGQDGYDKLFRVDDKLHSIRGEVEYSFTKGPFSTLQFGVNRTERDKSRAANEGIICISKCNDGAHRPVPGGVMDFPFAGIGGLAQYDAEALASTYNRTVKIHRDIDFKNWDVKEKLTTLYVQANIDTLLFGLPLKGNVGVQSVEVRQDSSGASVFDGVTLSQPAKAGTSYRNYLPSLNLKLELPAEQYIRFGAGRQMARPRMDQMRGNTDFSYDLVNNRFSGNGGNPKLRPWLADAYDLGYEKYFHGTGYVTVGYFYKNLKSYIYDRTEAFDFTGMPIPPGTVPAGVTPSMIGPYSHPVNGEGGKLYGVEAAVSIPFGMFWSPLEGFGVTSNWSMVKSTIHPNGPGTTDSLPGLSKYVQNSSVFFERWGFQARVSQRRRSDFRGEVTGFGGDRYVQNFKGEKVTDVQVGYEIQSGPLKNLSFLAQVYNLENQPFRQTQGSTSWPTKYQEYGRTYLFGVNYKF